MTLKVTDNQYGRLSWRRWASCTGVNRAAQAHQVQRFAVGRPNIQDCGLSVVVQNDLVLSNS